MNLSVDTKNDLMLANKLYKFINEKKKISKPRLFNQ